MVRRVWKNACNLAALLNNYQIETQFIKIKNFQHPNINLIIYERKAINKNSGS